MLSAIRVCSKLRPTVFRAHSSNVKYYKSANVVKGCQSKVLSPIIRTKINCRLIHISSPKSIPVSLALNLPAATSVISGALFRRWWLRQPIEKRSKLMAAFDRHLLKIWAIFGAYLASVVIYWVLNMKEVPITRRVRFMPFDPDEINDDYEQAVKAMLHQKVILEPSHPAAQRVLKTAERIIAANGDIERMTEMEWTVSTVDVPGMINAMVTGKGQIIIFKDMVDACATDDELGIVLAHEMSHAILDHKPEIICFLYLASFFTAPMFFMTWALFSSVPAVVLFILSAAATFFAMRLPHF
ncbi:Metalloendopeptidase OMA1, mitochondrial [Halotydeus destructor]|nr:Metalloendopeptidase OMA1, mitochondrial [Halotydeus destructor]